jgi:site-specific DNA recombinase
MKLAFYGRFSSDNQRETSIDDQFRIVERWAERHGHRIVVRFSDSATSGANLKQLTGLQNALDQAAMKPPPFEAITVDQLSRLSRDVGDTDAIVKRLRFFGLRIVAVSDNIDTADETTKISVTVKSLVNELYLDDLRKTTKRGLDGQFLKGFSTGGRTYGYRSEAAFDTNTRLDSHGSPVPIGYKIAVDPQQAPLVREIFRLFKEGNGEKAIAKRLNTQHIGRVWRSNTICLMLKNEKYAGRFFFNRREWIKNPETGRRVYRLRAREQWDTRICEDLRIVDDRTWEAVQQRLRTRRHLFVNRASRTSHLLSGLLFCDTCGGRLSIVGKDYYGCRNNAESGACANDIRIHRTSIEQAILSALAKHLGPFIDAICQQARHVASEPNEARHDDRRFSDLRQQAHAVMDAVRKGGLTGRALREALATYQRLWEELEALEQVAQAPKRAATRAIEVRYDRAVVEDFASRLPRALQADTGLGREFLRETLHRIRVAEKGRRQTVCPLCQSHLGKLTPQHMGKHGLTLEQTYRRFPELGFTRQACLVVEPNPEGIVRTGEAFGLLVAGEGFEPSTSGL